MREFTWVDGERTIHFGAGARRRAAGRAGLHAADHGARVGGRAADRRRPRARCTTSAPGRSHELAGDAARRGRRRPDRRARRRPRGRRGEGAGRGGPAVRAMAVPTTLSGAEMTPGTATRAASTSPRRACAARSSSSTPPSPPRSPSRSSPRARSTRSATPSRARARSGQPGRDARRPRGRAADRRGWATDEPDRETLALGALLAGYVIDSTGLGLHHVLAQSLVRAAGAGHGPANAARAPAHDRRARQTRPAGHRRARRRGDGEQLAATEAHDTPPGAAGPRRRRAAHRRPRRRDSLRAIGIDEADLARPRDAAAARPQLANTPPAADPRRDPRPLRSRATKSKVGRARRSRAAGRRPTPPRTAARR